MRLLFFGSPDFAVPSLRTLHAAGHAVAAVVTRPDRPRGRHGKALPTPVKEAALELGLEVMQPDDPGSPECLAALRARRARLGVVAAYGEILSAEAFSATSDGFINVHASLLPAYRGAAPVNWAVMRGEAVTGVTIIRMVPKLDAGPILASAEVPIGPEETAGEVEERLAEAGARLVVEVVGRLDAGEQMPGRPQPASGGFFARKLTKQDGRIDWTCTAAEIGNRVRGLTPWPGACCDFHGGGRCVPVTLLKARPVEGPAPAARPGEVLEADEQGMLVKAGEGAVRVVELKPSGSRAMPAADFVHGYRVRPGDRFE